ncbi:polyprenyl synthetase family protein [Fibrobacterota bacterium]
MNKTVFLDTLAKLRESVSPELTRAHEIMHEVATTAPGSLSKYLVELVARKGKRMRATFVLLIASSGREKSVERSALISASIELLHLATLVHDDIIDGSDMRRNGMTAHKKWGPRIAVLIGDFALSKALELIINEKDRRIPQSISRAASRLIAGEIQEIELSGNLDLTADEYFEVIYGKTASLWETCGECGALLAGFDDETVGKCTRLGKNMGMAFQIIDDLLDYGIGAEDLGKEVNTDLQNGLITLPLIFFFQNNDQGKTSEMKSLLNSTPDKPGNRRVIELLDETGSFKKTKEMAIEKINYCMNTINEFPRSRYFEYLIELCEIMLHRSA